MSLTKILQAIKNKWRIVNLYYKNWRNAPHHIQLLWIEYIFVIVNNIMYEYSII